jgi:hypothetical protein
MRPLLLALVGLACGLTASCAAPKTAAPPPAPPRSESAPDAPDGVSAASPPRRLERLTSLREGISLARSVLGDREAELLAVELRGLDHTGTLDLQPSPSLPAEIDHRRFACLLRSRGATHEVSFTPRRQDGSIELWEDDRPLGQHTIDPSRLMSLRDLAGAAAARHPDPASQTLTIGWGADQAEPEVSLGDHLFWAYALRITLREGLQIVQDALADRSVAPFRLLLVSVEGLDAVGTINLRSPRSRVTCSVLSGGSVWRAGLSAEEPTGFVDRFPLRLTSAQTTEQLRLVLDTDELIDSPDLVAAVTRLGPVPPHLAIFLDPQESTRALARFYEQLADDYRDAEPRRRVDAYTGELIP